MMKKSIVALAIAAAMMVTPAAAFADETEASSESEIYEWSYDDIDDSIYERAWITTGLAFDLYLPSDWNVIDPTTVDGAADAGISFMAQQPEDTNDDGVLWSIVVSVSDPDTVKGIDDILDQAEANTAWTEVEEASFNGIPGVTFTDEEKKISGVLFATDKGALVTVQLTPNDDNDFLPYFGNIINSICPTEEGETEALTE